ncbi:MAG: fused MFS/spermidine synthase [Candidatus Eremiobacteraeota bacterium]|nr:fused MFS/spermidine synthase [Candidatus Eremiobacteraeota bacterium]
MGHRAARTEREVLFLVTSCFFFSGMCGLIYQVLWTRTLSLIFGHTTFAVSTVITAFLGGLALGSALIGRWADREEVLRKAVGRGSASPALAAYGAIEVLVGVYCLFTPLLFKGVEAVYLKYAGLPFFALSMLRFGLCLVVLLFPTCLMGGTLPLLARFFIRREGEVGKGLGFLYFINTAGAVAGTVAAGFFLIPAVGTTATLMAAATVNIGIGAFVTVSGRRGIGSSGEDGVRGGVAAAPGSLDEAGGEALPGEGGEPRGAWRSWLFIGVFAAAGFASMVYEVAWTRAISLAIGSTTYAFSTMLATFLSGIALGSLIFSRLAARRAFSFRSFGWTEAAIGVASAVTIPLLGALPLLFLKVFPLVERSYALLCAADFMLCFFVMIVPTTLMGIAFPLAGKLTTRHLSSLGRSIGTIYAINTLGCIIGAFCAGFLLIPGAGIQKSLVTAVLINVVGGLAVLWAYEKRTMLRVAACIAALAAFPAAALIPPWNEAVMSSAPSVYARFYGQGKVDFNTCERQYVVFQRDGISSTVSVYKIDRQLFLRVNGKTDASTRGDMATQVLLGYLPAFYHRAPERAFVIGLGSGMTMRALLDIPSVKEVTCAEIEPAVIEAHRYFAPYVRHPLEDPRSAVVVADGRNSLMASEREYDVIVSEPSNPWIAGVANLFSKDFFEVCRRKLTADGVLCAWIHAYYMDPADFRMIVATLGSVFPHTAVWRGTRSDFLLIAGKQPLVFDYDGYAALFASSEAFRASLGGIGIKSPDALLAHFVLGGGELSEAYRAARINCDEYPFLEFSAPKSLYMETVDQNVGDLYAQKEELLPAMRGGPAQGGLSAYFYEKFNEMTADSVPGMARRVLEEGLSRMPRHVQLNLMYVNNLIAAADMRGALARAEKLAARNPQEYHYFALAGDLCRKAGDQGKALEWYRSAYEVRSDGPGAKMNYVKALLACGRAREALSVLDGGTTGAAVPGEREAREDAMELEEVAKDMEKGDWLVKARLGSGAMAPLVLTVLRVPLAGAAGLEALAPVAGEEAARRGFESAALIVRGAEVPAALLRTGRQLMHPGERRSF